MSLERAADGLWLLRMRPPDALMALSNGLREVSNVYLLEDHGGLTVVDTGSRGSGRRIAEAAAGLGEIKRIVLTHAHADHRGGAPEIGKPVFCHPDEVADAEGDDAGEHYFRYELANPLTRRLAPGVLRRIDGGPLKIAGTLADGDEVAGFTVLHLPGHAPGLIGLWRESDRTAIVSDAVFLFDPFGFFPRPGEPRLPSPVVRPLPDEARASMRRIAELGPARVFVGHYGPITDRPAERIARAAEGD